MMRFDIFEFTPLIIARANTKKKNKNIISSRYKIVFTQLYPNLTKLEWTKPENNIPRQALSRLIITKKMITFAAIFFIPGSGESS
tara:strand:+ start:1094 stop:1348 length:255 start_codon:yes stop_codon:yes gene_type:complete